MRLDELVSDDRVSKALEYLASTDEKFAEAKVATSRTEYMAKLAEAMAFKSVQVGSVEDKKAEAKMSKSVMQAWDTHYAAVIAYERLRASRERAVLLVDLWRSVNANRRQGHA